MIRKQPHCGHCGTEMEYNGLFDVGNGASPLYSCPKCLDVIVHFPTRARLLELVLTSVYNRVEEIVACPRDEVDKLSEALRVLVETALDEDKETAVLDMLKTDGTISEHKRPTSYAL